MFRPRRGRWAGLVLPFAVGLGLTRVVAAEDAETPAPSMAPSPAPDDGTVDEADAVPPKLPPRRGPDPAGPDLPSGPSGEVRSPGTADPRPIVTPDVVDIARAAEEQGDRHVFLLGFDRGFGVDTADRAFGISMGAQFIYRLSYGLDASRDYELSFWNFAVRPYFRAHAYGQRLRFYVLPEFSPTAARLLTVELTYQPVAAFAIRIGQFLTPFSRTYFTSSATLQFIDYGLANDVFRAGRDVGVMVFGTPFKGRFEYYAGLFNGNGMNRPELEPVHLLGVARVAYAPLGFVPYDQTQFLAEPMPLRVSFGLDGLAGKVSPTRYGTDPTTGAVTTFTDPDRRDLSGSADVHLIYGGFQVLAEGYVRRRDVVGSLSQLGVGGSVQTGYYVRKIRLGLAARANWVDLDVHTHGDHASTYEAEVDWYAHGNNLKLELDLLYGDAHVPMGRLLAGRQERATLQLHLFF